MSQDSFKYKCHVCKCELDTKFLCEWCESYYVNEEETPLLTPHKDQKNIAELLRKELITDSIKDNSLFTEDFYLKYPKISCNVEITDWYIKFSSVNRFTEEGYLMLKQKMSKLCINHNCHYIHEYSESITYIKDNPYYFNTINWIPIKNILDIKNIR